jgi:hypothetical protein
VFISNIRAARLCTRFITTMQLEFGSAALNVYIYHAGNNKGGWCKDYAQKLYTKYTQLEARHLYQMPLQIFGIFLNIS